MPAWRFQSVLLILVWGGRVPTLEVHREGPLVLLSIYPVGILAEDSFLLKVRVSEVCLCNYA